MLRWLLAALLLCGSAAAQTPPSFFGVMELAPQATPQMQVFAGTQRIWDSTWNGAGTHWADIETARGVYTTTAVDAVVNNYVSQGITNFNYTFGNVPGWSNGSAGSAIPPTDPNDFYTFVQFIVPHLAALCPTCTFSFEIWNEPSGTVHWNPGDDSGGAIVGATMTAYVQQVSGIVRGLGNSNLKLLSPSANGFFGYSWLDNFFSTGLAQYVDGIAVHVYPITNYYGNQPEQLLNQDQSYKAILAGYGSALPLYVTEGSWGNTVVDAPTQLRFASIYTMIHASDGLPSDEWYAYDGTNTWGQLWNGKTGAQNALNQFGTAFRVTQGWGSGATWTSPIARTALTNQIRNPTGTGVATVAAGACPSGANQGTPPTNWSVQNGDTSHGISSQFVGSGTENGVPYIDFRVCGTYAGGGSGFVNLFFETSTGIPAAVGQYWVAGASVRVLSGAPTFPTNLGTRLAFNLGTTGGSFLSGGPLVVLPIYSNSLLGQAQTTFSLPQPLVTSGALFVRPYDAVIYSAGQTFDVTLRIGAPTMDPGSQYSGILTEQDGASAQFIWDANGGPTPFTPAGTFHYWRDVYSGGAAIASTVVLTSLPLILESTQWGGVPW